MTHSSKKIIQYIRSFPGSFTTAQLEQKLDTAAVHKHKTSSGKRKNRKKEKNVESSGKIKEIINALVLIGYLDKNRKSYSRSDCFRLEGMIRVNTTGNGVMETDAGDVIIYNEDINNAHSNDYVQAELIDYRKGLYFGQVTKIVRRRREEYFAKIERRTSGHIYYRLMDTPGSEEVRSEIKGKTPGITDFAVVKLTGDNKSGIEECIPIEFFSGDDQYDLRRIIIKHSLPEPHAEYDELINYTRGGSINNNIPESELSGRKDYRKLFTVTIDGENAKDFDDAISLEYSRNQYTLYVHIADVSAFVAKGGELDREAFRRGTSYYLGNYVIPMLPEILSNNLCSLKAGEDRLTLSAEIVFDSKGNEIRSSFHRGIINVDKRLTYKSAEQILDMKKDPVSRLLNSMYDLTLILGKKRRSQGRIDLNLPEAAPVYKDGILTDIIFAERLRSHTLIEEFMLSANEVVSRTLTENNIPALYRVHERISDEKLMILKKFLRTLQIKTGDDANIGVAIQKVIDSVKDKKYEKVVNFIILKSFMQAYYGAEPIGHFGLGFTDYTHFTSPIRRYPDLIVHRCLKGLIDRRKHVYETSDLTQIGEKSSEMERVAQNAERDLMKLMSCRLMQDRIGETFEAIISGISKYGFYVSLLDTPVEGMVPLRLLTDDYYLVKEDEYTIIGKRRGKRYRLGDFIKVSLAEVSLDTMRIDFEVL